MSISVSQNWWCAFHCTGHVALRPRQTGASATPSVRGIDSAKCQWEKHKYSTNTLLSIYNYHHVLRSWDSRQKGSKLGVWKKKDHHNKQAGSCLAKNIMTNRVKVKVVIRVFGWFKIGKNGLCKSTMHYIILCLSISIFICKCMWTIAVSLATLHDIQFLRLSWQQARNREIEPNVSPTIKC